MKNTKYPELRKGSEVQYTDVTTSVLENGKIYEVFSVGENGIQVYIKTGFAGLTNDRFTKIKSI